MFLIGNILIKEPNYSTEILLTQVVIDLWLKTWKILIFAHFLL